MLSTGFTAAFGSLFGKTWRVYKIFSSSRHNNRMKLKDRHIFGFVLFLLAVDTIIFITWMNIAPFELEEKVLSKTTNTTQDLTNVLFYYKCNCKYRLEFTTTLFITKAILIFFGLFIAWQTRKVNIPILNDSKYIVMSIYNVVVVSMAGTITAIALQHTDYFEEEYIVVALSVCIATSATLFLVLIPKVVLLYGKDKLQRRKSMSTSIISLPKSPTIKTLPVNQWERTEVAKERPEVAKERPEVVKKEEPVVLKNEMAEISEKQNAQISEMTANDVDEVPTKHVDGVIPENVEEVLVSSDDVITNLGAVNDDESKNNNETVVDVSTDDFIKNLGAVKDETENNNETVVDIDNTISRPRTVSFA